MVLCAAWLQPCEAQTLSQLESWAMQAAADNRLAQSDIDVLEQRLLVSQAKQGLRIFGSVGLAHNRDVVSDTATVDYKAANAQIGVSLPLLGSAREQVQDVQEAGLALRLARLRREQTRQAVLRLLRNANAELYSSNQRIALGQHYLRIELQARGILQKRVRDHLLLIPDQLDFLSMFDLAKRELARDRAARQSAQFVLGRLTGYDVSAYMPQAPTTELPASARAGMLQASDRAPAVEMAGAVLEHRRADTRDSGWAGIDANLTLSQGLSHGIGVASGGSTSLGVAFSMPLDIAHERSALRAQDRARERQAEISLRQTQEKERQQEQAAISALDVQAQDQDSSRRQLRAAYAAWRIAHVRTQFLEGDVLEHELQKRYALYQAAMAYNHSLQLAAQGVIDTLALCPECDAYPPDNSGDSEISKPVFPTVPAPADQAAALSPTLDSAPVNAGKGRKLMLTPMLQHLPQGPSVWEELAAFDADWFGHVGLALSSEFSVGQAMGREATGLGWYVWNGWALVDSKSPWANFPDDIRRVYISFTASQLLRLAAPEAARRLRDFIDQAHDRGLTVDWLVGDPELIFSNGQRAVLNWLPTMQPLGFDGIDIDAEPSQLPVAQRSLWRDGIIRTVAALRAASTWPITLTINWRDLKKPGLSQELLRAGLSRAAVMIYVRNPNRVVELASRLLQDAPGLPMTVVQSIEPVLAADESTAGLGQNTSLRQWLGIAKGLQSWQNFRGIDVQSWEDFEKATP